MSQPQAQVHVHGPALRSWRLAADLSLERLAADAGVPQARLQAIEAAGSWTSVENDVARSLITALDCDFYDLFDVVEGRADGD